MLNDHDFTLQELETGLEHRFEHMQTIPRIGETLRDGLRMWKVAKVIHVNRGGVIVKANKDNIV